MNQEQIFKIGFGGGCHWCTEAIFTSLKGVQKVQQGYISSAIPNENFSEAVIVCYQPEIISLQQMIEVHLHTHASIVQHSMRSKYRSAIYYFYKEDCEEIKKIIKSLQLQFQQKIITQVLPFMHFKPSLPEHQNYFAADTEKPFCKRYIHPKLQYIQKKFAHITRQ